MGPTLAVLEWVFEKSATSIIPNDLRQEEGLDRTTPTDEMVTDVRQ
jgi:hypothetical protein